MPLAVALKRSDCGDSGDGGVMPTGVPRDGGERIGERFLAGVTGMDLECVIVFRSAGEASLIVARFVLVTDRDRDALRGMGCGCDGIGVTGGDGNFILPNRNGSWFVIPFSWKVFSGVEISETGERGAVALKTAKVPGVGGEMGEWIDMAGRTVLSGCASSQSENRSDVRVFPFNCTGGIGEGRGVSKSPSGTLILLNLELSSSR